jgi:hypothetical protein
LLPGRGAEASRECNQNEQSNQENQLDLHHEYLRQLLILPPNGSNAKFGARELSSVILAVSPPETANIFHAGTPTCLLDGYDFSGITNG